MWGFLTQLMKMMPPQIEVELMKIENWCVYIRFIREKSIGRQTATRIHEQKADEIEVEFDDSSTQGFCSEALHLGAGIGQSSNVNTITGMHDFQQSKLYFR